MKISISRAQALHLIGEWAGYHGSWSLWVNESGAAVEHGDEGEVSVHRADLAAARAMIMTHEASGGTVWRPGYEYQRCSVARLIERAR